MKKLMICLVAAGSLFIYSCQETSPENKTEVQSSDKPVDETPIKKSETIIAKDTAKTTITIGKDGGGFENKKGTGVSVDKNGVKVKTKDLKIDIKN